MWKHWIHAARLRTLPLALATVLSGSTAATVASDCQFDWLIFFLTLLTATLLQILSNFANDYGDGVKGTDALRTHGTPRAVQSGWISAQQMKAAVWSLAVLCLLSGVALLLVAFGNVGLPLVLFFLLGVMAITAAVFYTVGKMAYGYSGFGDAVVFVFFGIVGVCGTAFLQLKVFSGIWLLPASAVGLLSAAVLNLNNLRDLEDDRKAGKITIPVRLGFSNALRYHLLLVTAGCACWMIYALQSGSSLFAAATLLPLGHLFFIRNDMPLARFNQLLPVLALSILLVSLAGFITRF